MILLVVNECDLKIRLLEKIELGVHINFTFPMEFGVPFWKAWKILIFRCHFFNIIIHYDLYFKQIRTGEAFPRILQFITNFLDRKMFQSTGLQKPGIQKNITRIYLAKRYMRMQQWLQRICVIELVSLTGWILTYSRESIQCNSGWKTRLNTYIYIYMKERTPLLSFLKWKKA